QRLALVDFAGTVPGYQAGFGLLGLYAVEEPVGAGGGAGQGGEFGVEPVEVGLLFRRVGVGLLGDVLGHVLGDVADGAFGVFGAGGDAAGVDAAEPQHVGRFPIGGGQLVDGGVPAGQRLSCLG